MSMVVNSFSVAPGGSPFFGNVVFNAHMNGTNGSTTITNSCPRGTTAACHGTAALTTTSPLFGTASLSTTGAGTSYVDSGPHADYTVGTGDFFLEAAINTATPSQNGGVFAGNGTQHLNLFISGGTIVFRANSTTLVSGGTILTSTWQRLAVGRFGTTCAAWIDGTQIGTTTSAVNFDMTSFRIGTDDPSSGFFFFSGKIDEVRLTNGYCWHTTNYTPDIAAFPDS